MIQTKKRKGGLAESNSQFIDAVKVYGVRGLAPKLGITPAYVSMIASGKRPLPARLLTSVNKIADGFKPSSPDFVSNLERVMGFEPTTSCLGSKHSTAELHPPKSYLF